MKKKQSGQALVYGLGVMAVGLGGLFFLFNTGQLLQEKTKLTNTADAAAYAGGVMQARALNFNAYSNRALVANEVLVAQLVSISSWSLHARNVTKTIPWVFPGCNSPQGAAAYATWSFGLRYPLSCAYIIGAGPATDSVYQGIQNLAPALMTAVETSKSAIKASLEQIHLPLGGLMQARNQVMQEVVNANYAGDGTVELMAGEVAGLTDQWPSFAKKYTGNDRTRLANLARNAAFTDRFVPARNWTERAVAPSCIAPWRQNQIERTGGTSLIGLDEWQASDALTYVYRKQKWNGCKTKTVGLGSGNTTARNGGSGNYSGFSSLTWPQYTGIPNFYDLAVLNTTNPTLKLTIKLVRDSNQIKTGDARSDIRAVNDGNELNPNRFLTRLKGNKMQAMSASEVFFERPVSAPNARGQELASLFNPFWQVRLIQPDPAEVTAHAAAQ